MLANAIKEEDWQEATEAALDVLAGLCQDIEDLRDPDKFMDAVISLTKKQIELYPSLALAVSMYNKEVMH